MLTRRFKIILIICITCLVYGLWPMTYDLVYGQDNYLKVKGRTKANVLRFGGNLQDFPITPLEGELFYHQGLGYLKYFDGRMPWRDFGSGPRMVAGMLVAAANSSNRAAADFFCDGTNDQVEIQAAIDALGTKGGAVYLLEGTYNISAAINFDNTSPDDSGKSIIGAGMGTVLKATAGGINVIRVFAVNSIIVSQLVIDGTGTTNSCGVYFEQATRCKVDKVWVQNITDGVMLVSSSYNAVSNSHFNNARVRTAQSGGINSENNIISYNNFDGSSTNAIILNSANNNIISNNNVQNNSAAGIRVESGSNNIISNNNVQGNSEEGIFLTGTAAFTLISDNNIRGNSRAGIRLDNAPKDNLITANSIYDNGGAVAYDGISLGSDADRNLIFSNRIADTTGSGWGINISVSTCDDNYLVSNLISGSGYSGRLIRDSGTNTKYTDKLKLTSEKIEVNANNYNNFYYLDEVDGYFRFHFSTLPATYVAFNINTFVSLPLEDGRSPGDLLILENVNPDSAKYIQICDSSSGACNPDSDNCNLAGGAKTLYRYDTLKLIWNGTKWLQIGYVDNQP